MKALSLWQPWATLVVTAYKNVETRGWQTAYRGPIVIHAAKRTDDLDLYFNLPELRKALAEAGYRNSEDLPLGAALGVVTLIGIERTEAVRRRLTKTERAFGDYDDGRFAWFLANPCRFANPIPMRGAQGLFNCPIPVPLQN